MCTLLHQFSKFYVFSWNLTNFSFTPVDSVLVFHNSNVQFLQKVTDSIFLNILWNCKMMRCYLSSSMIFHYYPVTLESVLVAPTSYTLSQSCLEGISAHNLDLKWLMTPRILRQFAPISSFTTKLLSTFTSGMILCKYFHCWMFSGVAISSDATGSHLGRTFLEVLYSHPVFLLY